MRSDNKIKSIVLDNKLAETPDDIEKLRELAKQVIDSNNNSGNATIEKLVKISDCYANLIEERTSPKTSQWNTGALKAALEQMMVHELGGISSSTCKSGKDRNSLVILHRDALSSFLHKNGQLPDFNNEGHRKQFYTIFTDLFNTGHHQLVADQNAPGAAALKSIKKVLPTELVKHIDEKLGKDVLKDEQRIASTNKPTSSKKTLKQRLNSVAFGLSMLVPTLIAILPGETTADKMLNLTAWPTIKQFINKLSSGEERLRDKMKSHPNTNLSLGITASQTIALGRLKSSSSISQSTTKSTNLVEKSSRLNVGKISADDKQTQETPGP